MVIAVIRIRLMNENPDNTLLRRNTYSPPESISGNLVFMNMRRVTKRAAVIIDIKQSTIGSEVGGMEKKI